MPWTKKVSDASLRALSMTTLDQLLTGFGLIRAGDTHPVAQRTKRRAERAVPEAAPGRPGPLDDSLPRRPVPTFDFTAVGPRPDVPSLYYVSSIHTPAR